MRARIRGFKKEQRETSRSLSFWRESVIEPFPKSPTQKMAREFAKEYTDIIPLSKQEYFELGRPRPFEKLILKLRMA